MATFTRIKTWVSNEVLTAADLNGEFNNIINNFTPLGMEDYSSDVSQMQSSADPGGVGSESLATTIAGELQRLRFAIKRIAGGAQWYVAPTYTLSSQTDTAQIASNAVTTAKIADGSVTSAKLSTVRAARSSSSGSFSTASTSFVDVTNLSITSFPTESRPVLLCLAPDGIAATPRVASSGTSVAVTIAFLRDGTNIGNCYMTSTGGSLQIPPGSFNLLDATGVGASHTYKVQVKVNSGSVTIDGSCLVILPVL